jgi:uncharacterized protein (DUF1330 family)
LCTLWNIVGALGTASFFTNIELLKSQGDRNMPKAYWVTTYREIHDTKAMADYAALAGPAIAAAGGKFLIRGLPSLVYERGLMERTVVVEFPDLATAIETHEGAAYQEALKVMGAAADRDMRVVEGYEG